MTLTYISIGTIFTPFNKKEGMPIQPVGAIGNRGRIEIKPEFAEGLANLDGFSYIILIYDFHKSEGFDLKIKPFLSEKEFGVFSTRAPKRPNSIGLSVVKLLSINDNIIEVENIDILNKTLLLDIKPYVPEFDIHNAEKIGWMENKLTNISNTKSDNRFK
ncbi:MAG: tRNA (N6-threonylcarbamoyladenosine(37)-N6)-methyltransferase TrmO [Bacteroidota bacterium]